MEKLKNLLSRKFLTTLLSNVLTILITFGVDTDTSKIIGLVGLIIINAVYVITEGNIDKASLINITQTVSDELEDIVETK